ncbi:MAG: GAF domain-containing protein [Chloroflexi bacterium]|nr:GAF domain-containing protein [Chloroflexota bacterium]
MTETESASSASSYWRTLHRVTMEVVSSLKLDEVLGLLVRHVAEAMHVKAASLRLLDEDGEHLSQRVSYGLSEQYLGKGPVSLHMSPLDMATLTHGAVWLEDARSDSRFQYPKSAEQEGIVSVLCVPVKLHDQAIGVLRVYTDRRRVFDPEEVEFLQALANLGAVAIENARLHQSLENDYNQTWQAIMGISQPHHS